MRAAGLLGFATLIWTASLPVRSATPDKLMALGQHLAQECVSCHRLDGTDNGIPSIVHLDPEYFAKVLSFYKTGERNNPAMVSVAQSLDEEQIRALSLYLASLPAKGAR